MPEMFLLDTYAKSQVHEFILIARIDLELKVDIIIHNSSFLNLKQAFINSTSVEIVSPYRANYPQHLSFFAMISSELSISLPINVPELDSSNNLPDYWLELGSIRGNKTLQRHELENGVNFFNPNSLYWGNSLDYITMTYLPFFSNCKGFDKYIPLFSLFEQNPECSLIPPNETKEIDPFGFGSQPTADHCQDILLECIYDEDLDLEMDTPRWFEEGPNILFYVTKNPHPARYMELDSLNLQIKNVPLFSIQIVNWQ